MVTLRQMYPERHSPEAPGVQSRKHTFCAVAPEPTGRQMPVPPAQGSPGFEPAAHP